MQQHRVHHANNTTCIMQQYHVHHANNTTCIMQLPARTSMGTPPATPPGGSARPTSAAFGGGGAGGSCLALAACLTSCLAAITCGGWARFRGAARCNTVRCVATQCNTRGAAIACGGWASRTAASGSNAACVCCALQRIVQTRRIQTVTTDLYTRVLPFLRACAHGQVGPSKGRTRYARAFMHAGHAHTYTCAHPHDGA